MPGRQRCGTTGVSETDSASCPNSLPSPNPSTRYWLAERASLILREPRRPALKGHPMKSPVPSLDPRLLQLLIDDLNPWAFSFKWKAEHYRFPIDKYATRAIITKDDARDEADRLRRLIRAGGFPPQPTPSPATPEALTFETFAEKWIANARAQQSDNQKLNDKGIVRGLSKLELPAP